MADERLRTKQELKNLFTNLRRKGISDDMISILIDALWRDKQLQRTAGFYSAGGWDAEIAFDTNTRIFSIKPFDPLVEGFQPRYTVFSWSNEAHSHRIFETHEIEIPEEEGLYFVYFDKEPDPGRNLKLFIKKKPTEQEIREIFLSKAMIASLYWDATNEELIYFGNDKHGSEWNPQIHWFIHNTLGAQIKNGLQFKDYSILGDGSLDSNAQFIITEGSIIHNDFEINIPETTNTIPVLFFMDGKPRVAANKGYSILTGSRLLFNSGVTGLTDADNENYVLYHYFATNEINDSSRKIVSVMGISQYSSLQSALIETSNELDILKNRMPMQGKCYIDTAIFQTSDDYTNTVKSRLIVFVNSVWPDAKEYVTEMLIGDIDGVNTIFTTSKPYASGKISVLLNGLKEYHFSEINETTVQLDTPPKNTGFTDVLECIYIIK